jgi:glycogen debranching enzyme
MTERQSAHTTSETAARAFLRQQEGKVALKIPVSEIERATGQVVPWIFCRDDGAPVGDFKRAWATACIRAGFFRVVREGERERRVPTKLFHDFRRTAVRDLVRSEVS